MSLQHSLPIGILLHLNEGVELYISNRIKQISKNIARAYAPQSSDPQTPRRWVSSVKYPNPQSEDEHPLHPQLTHSMVWSSFNCALGTRQMQVALKFVSFVCIQGRQHSYTVISVSAPEYSDQGCLSITERILLCLPSHSPVSSTLR